MLVHFLERLLKDLGDCALNILRVFFYLRHLAFEFAKLNINIVFLFIELCIVFIRFT
jgi:hypothetical protein